MKISSLSPVVGTYIAEFLALSCLMGVIYVWALLGYAMGLK